MKIDIKKENNYSMVSIEGSLSMDDSAKFEDALTSLLNEKANIILNFQEVRFIDSTCLGIMVLYFSKSKSAGLQYFIINTKHDISQMFKLTGISKQIPCFSSLEKALESLQ